MNQRGLRLTNPGHLPAPRTDNDSLGILNQAINDVARRRTRVHPGPDFVVPSSNNTNRVPIIWGGTQRPGPSGRGTAMNRRRLGMAAAKLEA